MMQSNNREYIGRNEFWTPSTIGLTQSMIDASINNINLKDNSTNLFTVENNKLKSVIPMVCEEPTENEEISNKKYIDDKITDLDGKYLEKLDAQYNYVTKSLLNQKVNEINNNLGSNYYTIENCNSLHNNLMEVCGSFFLTKSDAESTYAKKSDIPSQNISSTSFSLVNYGSNNDITLSEITTRGAGSRVEIPIPSSVTGNTKIVFIDFIVNCPLTDVKDMLNILSCTLNTKNGSNASDYMFGNVFTGLRNTPSNLLRSFSVSNVFIGDISSLYLHFYFNDFTNKYGNNTLTIPSSSTLPTNLNVKIISF